MIADGKWGRLEEEAGAELPSPNEVAAIGDGEGGGGYGSGESGDGFSETGNAGDGGCAGEDSGLHSYWKRGERERSK